MTCENCGSTCVVKVGEGSRCNECGGQWDRNGNDVIDRNPDDHGKNEKDRRKVREIKD